ncbi:MAG TPA: error-prone DNA polymerase [Gemmatimonadaceae bacterium]|nr:error-prone DNA polymerase [Gemmatimonadaceae bacterium]
MPVELRAHTAFSFGDGAVTPEAMVKHAAELGYGSIGITDTTDLGGIVRFALEAKRQGVRPIAGAELNVEGFPVGLIARTAEGFRNIASLVTRARVHSDLRQWTKGQNAKLRGRPRVSWKDVAERSAGVHVLTGPAAGPIAACIQSCDYSAAARTLDEWREVFGERLAVEVSLHHAGGCEAALAAALIELAGRHHVPWVVAHDPRYIDTSSRLVHDILTALRYDTTIESAMSRGLLHPNGEWRLLSPEELAERWKGREEGLVESDRIASECDFNLAWLRPPLPKFAVPEGHSDITFLREKVYEGAHERWGDLSDAQTKQIEHELGIIGRLGFSGFFLVMWDAIHFARSRNILCQGRGSAANSAVAYCLAVTAVDPVANGLLFERFLSEMRVDGLTEAPDIDVDIEHDRREEVLDYMYDHYARAHSAIACIVQTYRAPNALRDSMRAFGYPIEQANDISKRLHYDDPIAGAESVRQTLGPQFGLNVEDPRCRTMLAAMAAFEELPRLRATHVGGFVLSSEPLGDYMPIEHTTMGRTIIQFDKDDLDAVGVPKFDFLGLGALSLVRRAFDMIEVRTGNRPQMYKLPVNDPKTYELIASGETIGTFQIESRAQIASILHTMPDRMYDLVVQVALIRPGPIQAKFVHPYTKRRRGLEPVTYAHPLLEPILKRTQGIPIFQEQAMAIAMVLGGYTAAEADELRRTMGHVRKISRLLDVLGRLRDRMIVRGVEESVATGIVEDLKSFANYGFPESHAWSFALIAYATGWLKAHYREEFFAALLNSWPMGFYPPSTLIHDARRHGVVVRPPCLSIGEWECTVEPIDEEATTKDTKNTEVFLGVPQPKLRDEFPRENFVSSVVPFVPSVSPSRMALRIGWRHVRGLGEKTLDALRLARGGKAAIGVGSSIGKSRSRRARKAETLETLTALSIDGSASIPDRPFTSIEDVVLRAKLRRNDVLYLARAGAFAAWEPDRRRAGWEALRAVGDSLPLAPTRHDMHEPRKLSETELIYEDYFATGMSISGHPMQHMRERLRRSGVVDSEGLKKLRGGEKILVAGLVTIRQRPASANGTIFLLLEDEWGFINIVVPSFLVEKNSEVVKFATFIVVKGRFEKDGNVLNVIGEKFKELNVRPLEHTARSFR